VSGLLAGFATEQAMEQAFARLRAAGIDGDTYTPRRPENVGARSRLPLLMLLSGLIVAAGLFALQAYALGMNYRFDVGGRPLLSWPAYIPLTFEGGVLAAMVAGFVGFLVANRLPHLYDTIDEIEGFREASRDTYFVAIRAEDHETIGRARELLRPLRPTVMEYLPS
jgi:hypothetical protein